MKFEFPAHNSKNLFKFQAQDSDLEYLFWRFDKHIALSEKNLPLISRAKVTFPYPNYKFIHYNSNNSIIPFQESQTGEEGGHSSEDSGHCSPEPESEFLKVRVHAVAGFHALRNT